MKPGESVSQKEVPGQGVRTCCSMALFEEEIVLRGCGLWYNSGMEQIKIAFHTLGCKVNQYETEALKERFAAAGYLIGEETEAADVYVVNTCTVTNLADRKSRQFIRRAHRLNPAALIAVTGCYAETDPEEVNAIEGVDLVIGNRDKQRLPEIVAARLEARDIDLPEQDRGAYHSDGIITGMEDRTRAYIKIEEGCDRFCSYCIIPYARGRVRSRDPEEIVTEVTGLLEQGFKEIVLTGINTALYGKDLGLSGVEPLIARLDALPYRFRIRLSSLEPTVIDAAYAAGLTKYKKLCPHLHLSIQSGADSVLAGMHRRYDRAEYLEIVKALRAFDPLYGLSTDIIVGFPGETEEDFEDSLRMTEEAEYVKVHAFKYSKRRGTVAAERPDQVPDPVKADRAARLARKAEDVSRHFREKCRGAERQVLFEERKGKLLSGYTDNYIRVYCEGPETLLNELCTVKLEEVYKDGMKGVILDG